MWKELLRKVKERGRNSRECDGTENGTDEFKEADM